jgi:hypothetical protein
MRLVATDGREILFACDSEEVREGWIHAIQMRRVHSEMLQWEKDHPEELAVLHQNHDLEQQLVLLLAKQIDRRQRIQQAELDVTRLILESEHRRMQRRVGRHAMRRGLSGLSDSIPRFSASKGDTTAEEDFDRCSVPSNATASSFSSFAGQVSRGLYARATWVASVKDEFAKRGTWLYKTSRKRVKQAPQTFADKLADKILTTSWTKRYVKVRGDALIYSVTERDEVKGIVKLNDIVDVGTLSAADLAKLKSPYPHGFVLRTADFENVWCSESAEIRDAWVCALERQLLEDADKEREEQEWSMRPRLGVMEVEARTRGEIEDAATQHFMQLKRDIDQQMDVFREEEFQLRVSAHEKELVAQRRAGSANIPMARVPPHHLDMYCRALNRTASKELSTALASAVFDADGLCLTATGEHAHALAAAMASLLDVASQLHPSFQRRIPDAIVVELDRKAIHVAAIDTGLFGLTMALPHK